MGGQGPSEAPAPAVRQDDEVRGESSVRRMPLRAGSGRVHSPQICGRPQNRGAVTGERGQIAASLSSYFIPAAITRPRRRRGRPSVRRDKEEN